MVYYGGKKMLLKEFIEKYSVSTERGWSEYLFECQFDEEEGFVLPEDFQLINSISRIPLFIIAINRDEKAIIKFDGQLSLSIFDSEVQMDAAISLHEEESKAIFKTYLNFKHFCDSIAEFELIEIIDAISNEVTITEQIEGDNKKKDAYIEDLMVLLRLFTNNTFPQNDVRPGFIRDAYDLLRKLQNSLISVQSMDLVKIADVYYTETDETYYVLKKDYDKAYEYIGENIEDTRGLLIRDGWQQYGKLARWDEVFVEAYMKDNKIIAIWDDAIQ